MSFAQRMQRLGLMLPAPRRPTVVLAGTADEIDRLHGAVDAALRERPGYRLILAAPAASVFALRRRYTHETVLTLPHAATASWWNRRLDVGLVVGMPHLAGLFAGTQVVDAGASIPALLPPLERPAPAASASAFLPRGLHIASIEALKVRLGQPRTIMCLGNGPSSEDPSLARYGGATLFRVNWNYWRRGWMTAPHVVFTADPDLPPPRRQRPILVFPTGAAGRPILRRHTLLLRPPTAGYAFAEEFALPQIDLSGPLVPTNGAVMVAVAAALQPERMVIAGIDLYSHASGRYPGAQGAMEGYAREHSRDADLALIHAALAGFCGEVVHLGENLRKALAEPG